VDFDHLTDLEILGDIAFSCLGTTLEQRDQRKAMEGGLRVPIFFCSTCLKMPNTDVCVGFCLWLQQNSAIFYSSMKGKLEEAVVQLDFEHTYIFQPGMLDRPDTDRKYEKLFVRLTNGIAKLLLKTIKPHTSLIWHTL
jgi:hypothetical protein